MPTMYGPFDVVYCHEQLLNLFSHFLFRLKLPTVDKFLNYLARWVIQGNLKGHKSKLPDENLTYMRKIFFHLCVCVRCQARRASESEIRTKSFSFSLLIVKLYINSMQFFVGRKFMNETVATLDLWVTFVYFQSDIVCLYFSCEIIVKFMGSASVSLSRLYTTVKVHSDSNLFCIIAKCIRDGLPNNEY